MQSKMQIIHALAVTACLVLGNTDVVYGHCNVNGRTLSKCEFYVWQSWGSCSSNCGYGVRTRYRQICCGAEKLHAYDDYNRDTCGKSSSNFKQTRSCRGCNNGGQWSGSRCHCPAGYTGTCCSTRVPCGAPDDLTNGNVTYSSTYYQATCHYMCQQHYQLTGGSTSRTCQSSGVWSGSKPRCAYVNHCASVPCLHGGTCQDLLDNYSCTCITGWSGVNCETDIQPPVMSGCPVSFSVNATAATQEVTWESPTFSDPMGHPLTTVANYPTPAFTFPWDDFDVQYVAHKPSNGQQTECRFTISVRPTPCDDLNIPANGALVCNGWRRDFGRICLVACRSGYTIDPSRYEFETVYVCGASGHWIASPPVPDCSVHMSDTADISAIQSNYGLYSYDSPSCSDPAAKTSLQNLYIRVITGADGFREFCARYPDECLPENVLVDC